jgi:oligopeptide transport system substrate-binding protein
MKGSRSANVHLLLAIAVLSFSLSSCSSSASSNYFGQTVPPKDNVLRYISGAEPESLDPQVSSGQPEARIYMAIYEGLVEYGPKDLQPIPAIAKSWEISPGVDVFLFHLRDNAKWSDGTPIKAGDFVYSYRRGFAPETLSRTSALGFAIKYSEAYNSGQVFVKKDGRFILESDVDGSEPKETKAFGHDTEFDRAVRAPARLTMDADAKKRDKAIASDPKLQALTTGAEFVPIKAEDIGLEAIDDYTLRITLKQPAPYFLGLLAHQFFRLVPKHVIEKWDKQWWRPEHIVTCGPFKIKTVRPYDALIVEKDPNYWDAANVKLSGIEFYPLEEQSTQMNLYKSGAVYAVLNHTVPSSWIDQVRQYKDEYLNHPENSTAYYSMNVTKPPFDNIKVRRAFHLAVDRIALSNFRKVTKPLFEYTPGGIFPDYDKARAKVGEEIRNEKKLSPEAWEKYLRFDDETARRLLTEAGFPVQKNGDGYSCPNFPTDTVALSYNTSESNRQIAEFVQAQWKKHLGITVPLKNMEFKTFLPFRNALQYDGMAQSLWSGDYMDPYTFLSLHYGKTNDGAAGFNDPKYNKMLDDANAELDPQKRYEMLARAEYYLIDQMPALPLTINATNWVKKPFVKGMYPNPGTLMPWKFVYIEMDPNKWDRNVDNIMAESDPQVDSQLKQLMSTQTPPSTAKAE